MYGAAPARTFKLFGHGSSSVRSRGHNGSGQPWVPPCATDRGRGPQRPRPFNSPRDGLWQPERYQAVADRRAVHERPAGRDHGDILLAVGALIGHRRSMGAGLQLLGPDFLARLGLKSAEAAVVGGADEDQPARRRQRRTQIGPAGISLSFRHDVAHAQIDAPGDLAGVDVHGPQIAPGRVLARVIAMARYLLLEEAVRAGGRTPIAVLLFLELLDRAQLLGIDDEIAEAGIKGAAAPFRPATAAGETRYLRIHGERRERHAVMQLVG